MKSGYWRLLLVPVVVALTAGLGVSEQLQLAATQASLTFLTGDVQVRHGAESYGPGKLNEVLRAGDAVKTGKNSRAQLSLGSDRYVRLDQNTQLLLTYVQGDGLTSLKTLVGNVWVTIERKLGAQSKFEVTTPSVVAAVRGTVFNCQVEEDGTSQVDVYEGEVEVNADQEQVRVSPDHYCRYRRGQRAAVLAADPDRREAEDFVQYNRHRDALQHLGNPLVLVALTEAPGMRPQPPLTAETLVADLTQRGFVARAVTAEEGRQGARTPEGWLRPAVRAEYVLVGHLTVQGEPRLPRQPARVTAKVTARLAAGNAELRRLLDVSTQATATAPTPPEAVRSALTQLGHELARRMLPQMLTELAADQPSAVRLDVLGLTSRQQFLDLAAQLRGLEGVCRVTPLPKRTEGPPALLVAGTVTPEALAETLRRPGGAAPDSVVVSGRVVKVRLAGAGQ